LRSQAEERLRGGLFFEVKKLPGRSLPWLLSHSEGLGWLGNWRLDHAEQRLRKRLPSLLEQRHRSHICLVLKWQLKHAC
jgi:hypothetical protein